MDGPGFSVSGRASSEQHTVEGKKKKDAPRNREKGRGFLGDEEETKETKKKNKKKIEGGGR